MKLRTLALAMTGMAVMVSAHHTLENTYDLKKEVRLEGKIVQILLRNPHSFLQVDVPDQDGQMQRWSLEFPKGANSLLKQGIEPGMLKVGDQVTVVMNPPFKPGSTLGSLVDLYRASDGFEWKAKVKRKQS